MYKYSEVVVILGASTLASCAQIAGVDHGYYPAENTGGSSSSTGMGSAGGGMAGMGGLGGMAGAGGGQVCVPDAQMPCYSGPAQTTNVGTCKPGKQICKVDGSGYGECLGEVLPTIELCETPEDEDCDGNTPPCPGTSGWSKSFGDGDSQIVSGLAVATDGSATIAGQFYGSFDLGGSILTSAGANDVMVARFNSTGNMLWAKGFGDPGSQEARAVVVDSTNAVILTGAFSGILDFGNMPLMGAGGNDIFLAKLDATGSHLWSKSFGNNGNQYGNGVAVSPSGDITIIGYITGAVDFGGGSLTSAGGTDVCVARFDSNGNHKWGKLFGNVGTQYGTAIASQPSGNVIIAGQFGGVINFGVGSLTTAGLNDIFLATLDSSGTGVWSKRFGDSVEQSANAVAVDANNGNIALTGSFEGTVDFGGGTLTSAGGKDVYVAVFNAMGDHLWSKAYGNDVDQVGRSVAFDATGNVLVTGAFNGMMEVISGTPLMSSGANDVFVAMFGSNGTPLWNKRAGDANEQVGYAVGADGMSNIFVAGAFAGNIDFGLGALMSAGLEDIFLAKLSP